MRNSSQICGWRWAVACGVVCFALPAAGQTASSAEPPASAPAKQAKTTKHPSSHSASQKAAAHKPSAHKGKHTRKTSKSSKKRGQKAIDSERVQQIQAALIREHYMSGEPSGNWDASTQAALRKFQADQGWQSKTVPDSRALIKLGLGPSKDGLLNPESAMTTSPLSADPKSATKAETANPPAQSVPPADPSPSPQ